MGLVGLEVTGKLYNDLEQSKKKFSVNDNRIVPYISLNKRIASDLP
jgi:hypothetical protein